MSEGLGYRDCETDASLRMGRWSGYVPGTTMLGLEYQADGAVQRLPRLRDVEYESETSIQGLQYRDYNTGTTIQGLQYMDYIQMSRSRGRQYCCNKRSTTIQRQLYRVAHTACTLLRTKTIY